MYELTLVPAYGRDYKSKEECLKDWKEGKDFLIRTVVCPDDGRYTSIRDIKSFPGEHVKIRYNKLEDCILINIKTDEVISNDKDQT